MPNKKQQQKQQKWKAASALAKFYCDWNDDYEKNIKIIPIQIIIIVNFPQFSLQFYCFFVHIEMNVRFAYLIAMVVSQ